MHVSHDMSRTRGVITDLAKRMTRVLFRPVATRIPGAKNEPLINNRGYASFSSGVQNTGGHYHGPRTFSLKMHVAPSRLGGYTTRPRQLLGCCHGGKPRIVLSANPRTHYSHDSSEDRTLWFRHLTLWATELDRQMVKYQTLHPVTGLRRSAVGPTPWVVSVKGLYCELSLRS